MRTRRRQSAWPCATPVRGMRPSRSRARSATGFDAGPGAFPGKTTSKVVHRSEGNGMLHPLRATARLIDQKIGWNRIGLALSLIIIAAAAIVLYRILGGIDFSEVMVALKATEPAD